MKWGSLLEAVIAGFELELHAGLLEDIRHICSWVDLDHRTSEGAIENYDVGRHGSWTWKDKRKCFGNYLWYSKFSSNGGIVCRNGGSDMPARTMFSSMRGCVRFSGLLESW